MYNLRITPQQMASLYQAREYLARGSIAQQVRTAVDNYLRAIETEVGASIGDVTDAIEKHTQESAKK